MAPTLNDIFLTANAARRQIAISSPHTDEEIAFQYAWNLTHSLSAAAQILLNKSVAPSTISAFMKKDDYVTRSLPQTKAAIQKAFQLPEVAPSELPIPESPAQKAASAVEFSLFFRRAVIARSMKGHFKSIFSATNQILDELKDSPPEAKLSLQIELIDLQNLARLLVEQEAFKQVTPPAAQTPEAQIEYITKMIAAGSAALSVFDARLAAQVPLSEICAEAVTLTHKQPPTPAQIKNVAEALGGKNTGSRKMIS